MRATTRMVRAWWWRASNGAMVLHQPSTGRQLRMDGLDVEQAARLLDVLHAGVPAQTSPLQVAALAQIDADAASVMIEQLADQGIVATFREEDSRAPADRQEAFLGLWERPDLSAREADQRLRSATVTLVGAGGYGSWVSAILGRIGVRKLVLFDGDIVSPANLSRQILYTADDIGSMKTEVAKDVIERVGRGTSVQAMSQWADESPELHDAIEESDLVLSEWTWGSTWSRPDSDFAIGEHLLRTCARTRTPLLSYVGNVIGPLTIPGKTACPFCLRHADGDGDGDVFGITHSAMSMRRNGAPSMAPRLALTAGAVTWEAARYLSGHDSVTERSVIHLSPFDWSAHLVPAARDDRCTYCQPTIER
ncbi:ThiF family protein [Pimelobacter simplex]|nr:ThiF family protein [Pimelobacter simplex]